MVKIIQEIPISSAPIGLLMIADPSESRIRSYLPMSKCFTISAGDEILGACVVRPNGDGSHELMSIAVLPAHQNSGLGTVLLKWVIEHFRAIGATELLVGTGTFGYQLAFYQRQGFRVATIERDYFIKNYPEPIFENGIQLFDMLILKLVYRDPFS
ncbi:MAG: GNAT family N-acetyltransferase [Bacteroidetes bacterium]|nr:GNAT family N-acetyltransferase [Bacteroidota bacterium]